MAKKERGLGRGLEALLSPRETEAGPVVELGLKVIVAQVNQPRKMFAEEPLQELAESIKEHGVLQPVLVRPKGEFYEIIAGERRWRAAEKAGLDTIPALIKEITDLEAAEISLVENLQREDLSAIEEARAYKNLIEYYKYTQEEVAEKIGKSRAYIANTIRLLQLDPEVIAMIDKKQISPGHARALLSLRNAREQIAAANEIIKGKLSVRQIEKKTSKRKVIQKPNLKSPEYAEIEEKMQKHLSTKAEINQQGKGGKIEITYYNEQELERILDIIGIV